MQKINPAEEQLKFLKNKEKQVGAEHLKDGKGALYNNGLNKIWKIIEFTGNDVDPSFFEVNYGTYLLFTPLAGFCNYYLLSIQKLVEEDSKVTDLSSFELSVYGLSNKEGIPNPNFWNVDLAKIVGITALIQFAIKNDSDIKGLIEHVLKHITNGTINAVSCISSWGLLLNVYLSDNDLYCEQHLEHVRKLGINKLY